MHLFHIKVIHVALLERIRISSISSSLVLWAFVGVVSCLLALEAGYLTEVLLYNGASLPIAVVAAIVIVALIASDVASVSTTMVVAMIVVAIPTMVVSLPLKARVTTAIMVVVLLVG